MRCARCGSDNPEGAKFCIECAAPFPRRCPQCGMGNPPQAKFCAECATPLKKESANRGNGESEVASAQLSVVSPHPLAAERRQLTVLFCDLVGSTALSTQLDPEELREVVRQYQQTCAEVIERYDGHIAQYLGDGLLVYFGYPTAHEDDAARAVRAGVEIITAITEQVPSLLAGEGQGEGAKNRANDTPHPHLLPQGEKELRRLHVRLGIHTGLVVVGEMGGLVWDLRCEPEHMRARVEEAERLGRAHSLPFISDVLAQVIKGLAWLRAGCLAKGIPQLRGALETWNAHGNEIFMPYYRAVLAEGLALSGDSVGGLRLIEDNLNQIARPGWEERWYLAEVLRLKGELLLAQDGARLQAVGLREKTKEEGVRPQAEGLREKDKEAEECFLKAIEVAQEQQAKSWELRAATSLARLWQQQDKRAEAHKLLSEIYHWFTEGFDTKDLQEAKTLLEELSD
ncbi:MAG: zinc ribbon domain-containing protein [Deltaproteobacteria bacterium]|nr:zinc ribbon domain-containing protein [Deltaproteobacteria bacterium]